jgi:hypothetical protein
MKNEISGFGPGNPGTGKSRNVTTLQRFAILFNSISPVNSSPEENLRPAAAERPALRGW